MEALASRETAAQAQREPERGAEILSKSRVESQELGALAKLPPFSPVAISLLRLFDREDVPAEEVAKLVQSDPTLASELLAVVNSPLFAFRTRVTSPAHAINLLGSERTRSLAATLATRTMMQGGPRIPVVRRFWVHSIATATIGKSIGPFFGTDPELCHLGGLLHELGRLGLLAAHPVDYSRMALAAHENVEEILEQEQSQFGMTHCHAGALLAKAWFLPEFLQDVTAHHLETSSGDPVVAVVQLSCRIANGLMYQSVHHRDARGPEENIELYAPARLRKPLIASLEATNAAVAESIKTLDF